MGATLPLKYVAVRLAVRTRAPPWAVLLLLYWAIGGITYHALSVRLASLMYEAAASVGLKGGDVLAWWKG